MKLFFGKDRIENTKTESGDKETMPFDFMIEINPPTPVGLSHFPLSICN
jgi:hypothetical protein